MIRQLATPFRALLRARAGPSVTVAIQHGSVSASTAVPEADSTASTSGRSAAAFRPVRFQSSLTAEEDLAGVGLVIDETAVQRLKQLQAKTPDKPLMLRIEVQGGGCSGFQYIFKIDSETNTDDKVFTKDGAKVVCDSVSLGFLRGAKIEFEDSLMRSAFQISQNPNSEATCGCGSSFVAKM